MSWFQALLDGIGAVVAWLYDVIPNYGVAIIVLTLGIRVLLLPLAVKQIRSMHAMQAIAPKQKEIQRKYKGNRARIQEETMRLYREEGVNPLSGCLPILAQFPVLIALFAVLSVPNGLPHVQGSAQNPTRLYRDILAKPTPPGLKLVGANLVCSASEAGRQVNVAAAKDGAYPKFTKDCGKGGPVRIPFYFFLAAMIATTYYQQKQMQRASPSQNQQQQMIMRIMPAFFGFIGFTFPAALVVYWTTTNVVQIIQQHFMLPKAPVAAPSGATRAQGNGGKRARPQRGASARRLDGRQPPRGTKGSLPGKSQASPEGESSDQGQPRAKQGGKGPSGGGGSPGQGSRSGRGPGGRNGGSRKKRRKR